MQSDVQITYFRNLVSQSRARANPASTRSAREGDREIVIDLLVRGRIDPSGTITTRFRPLCATFVALKRPSDQIKVMLEPT
jgi:threonine dehydrogenase-like Zn-dependent dehydrogenase